MPLPITHTPRQVGTHHCARLSCGDRDDGMLREAGQTSDTPAPPAGTKPTVLPTTSCRDREGLQGDKLSMPASACCSLAAGVGKGELQP